MRQDVELDDEKKTNSVILCSSPLDDVDFYVELAFELNKELNYEFSVKIRSHPSDAKRRSQWVDKCQKMGIKYIDPEIESVYDSIAYSAAIVASESNILLDAAILGVKPISIKTNDEFGDHYGFVKSGLAYGVIGVDEIVALIGDKHPPQYYRQKAKKYSDTIGTKYFGAENMLVGGTISKLIYQTDTNAIACLGWEMREQNVWRLKV
jgi:hypothetical protein